MNLSEIVLLTTILIFFPLAIYLFYIAHNRNISKEENNMFFGLALFTSLYLITKFGFEIFAKIPVLSIDIPIFLAYCRNRKVEGIILSIFVIICYHTFLNLDIFTLCMEYLLFYIIFLAKNKYRWNDYIFIIITMAIKGLFFYIAIYLNKSYNILFIDEIHLLILFISSLVSTLIIIFCLKIGDDILKYHMNIKELEQEKQIRSSLFKITHEIKNPLAVCKGYLDMFDVNNIEHSKKYIPIMKKEINFTLILLQDFLSMTKINVEKEIIDINLLLEEVTNSLRPLLNEKNIEFIAKIGDNELFVFGDYNRLNQVIINVVKNSIEAIPDEKQGRIKMSTRLNSNNILIYIEDNGSGISKENLKKIMEPFFTTKCNGTGLGLSLSSEIIKAHKGELSISSELNKGTKVTICLPIKKTI
ncbi:MAG: sensor histidine kinase [Ignavibacteriales bacterium]